MDIPCLWKMMLIYDEGEDLDNCKVSSSPEGEFWINDRTFQVSDF